MNYIRLSRKRLIILFSKFNRKTILIHTAAMDNNVEMLVLKSTRMNKLEIGCSDLGVDAQISTLCSHNKFEWSEMLFLLMHE